jgi:hypothetical protein
MIIHGMDILCRDWNLRRKSTSRAGKNGSALSMDRCATLGFARRVELWREIGKDSKSAMIDLRQRKRGWKGGGRTQRRRKGRVLTPPMKCHRISRLGELAGGELAAVVVPAPAVVAAARVKVITHETLVRPLAPAAVLLPLLLPLLPRRKA